MEIAINHEQKLRKGVNENDKKISSEYNFL